MQECFRRPPDLRVHLDGLLRQIPAGRVATCGALARALGDVVASRWIGTYLRQHEHGPDCPCHRVVLSDGKIGGYLGGDLATKRQRLAEDGIGVVADRVDLQALEFAEFTTDRPLQRLSRQQHELLEKVVVAREDCEFDVIGGVDVSYIDQYEGVAAYALVDVTSGQLVWSKTMRRPVVFPYITSYLAYRELPILLELLDEVRRDGGIADVVLVDGSGIMHPRGAGIATQLGVAADLVTIGVTKKHLFGKVAIDDMRPGEQRTVRHDNRPIGVAMRRNAKSKRPLFVSPGHRTTVDEAERCVESVLRQRSLPEPIYWADRLSRTEARLAH